MTGRHLSIPLGAIIAHPRLQNRNAAAPCMQHLIPTDSATIEHLGTLKLAIKRGDQLPPVSVVEAEDGKPGRFYLVDGYHRYWAHMQSSKATIEANILSGKGFTDALVSAGRANKNHGLRLTKDQMVENAWRNLNLPESDYYRRLNKTQAEAELGIDRETIKKMRQKVRQWGIEAGAIDANLKGSAAEEALLSYWNDKPAPDTWRMARRDGSVERKNPHWQEKKAARALAQLLVDYAAAYGPEVAKRAMNDIGFHLHSLKPAEGIAKLGRSFSVSPKPLISDDEAILSKEDEEVFLEYQRRQAFDSQPPSQFFNNYEHLPAEEF